MFAFLPVKIGKRVTQSHDPLEKSSYAPYVSCSDTGKTLYPFSIRPEKNGALDFKKIALVIFPINISQIV